MVDLSILLKAGLGEDAVKRTCWCFNNHSWDVKVHWSVAIPPICAITHAHHLDSKVRAVAELSLAKP